MADMRNQGKGLGQTNQGDQNQGNSDTYRDNPGIRKGNFGRSKIDVAEEEASDPSIATDVHMNSITNPELVKQFPEQIKSGRPFVFFGKESQKDPAWIDVYFAQGREVEAPQNMGRGQLALSPFELMLKGFDGPSIVRHRDTFLRERLEQNGITEGALLPEGINIAQIDSIIPENDIMALRPRLNNEGFVLKDGKGNPIYRQTKLVTQDTELDVLMDFVISDEHIDQFVPRMEEVIARREAAVAAQQ